MIVPGIVIDNGLIESIAPLVGGALTIGGSAIAWIVRQRSKSESPVTKADADTAFVTQAASVAARADESVKPQLDAVLITQAMGFANSFSERAEAAEARAATADERMNALEGRVKAVETRMSRIVTVIRQRIVPIVAWMDEGANPPAPTIHNEVRELIASLDELHQ